MKCIDNYNNHVKLGSLIRTHTRMITYVFSHPVVSGVASLDCFVC
jgi:hypothetical protein